MSLGLESLGLTSLGLDAGDSGVGSTDPVIVDVTPDETVAVVTYTGIATHYRLDGGTAIAIGASPATIIGLTANTEYDLELTGDEVTWSDVVAFGTLNEGEGDPAYDENFGTLAATESGSDTAAISGGPESPVTGSLAAVETGSDTAAISGDVYVAGVLAASESGIDTASISGAIIIAGSLSASEAGSDTAVIRESTPVATGSLAATESGSDTAAINALSLLYGSTTSVWYLPVRMYATGVSESVDPTQALDNLRSLLPSMTVPAVDAQGKFTPSWYRFLDYLVNVFLGGPGAPTMADVQSAIEAAIAAQTIASQTTALIQQQAQTNAEALAATVEVLNTNAIAGAAEIPRVSLSYLEP